MSFSLFLCSSSAVFLWRVSARKQRQCLLEVTEEKCMFFFAMPSFPPSCLRLHFFTQAVITLCEPNFPFSLAIKDLCLPPPILSFVSDWRLRSHSRYSCILSFCCGVAVNQVCEMEMRSLSLSRALPLSPTLSLPLFPDIKTRLCLQCFSQILECCQIL